VAILAEPRVAKRLSIYDIAKRTGHSHVAVHNAIDRLGILPDEVTPGGARYFSENVVMFLKEKMRPPQNGNGSSSK
jgi:hypothetical protein